MIVQPPEYLPVLNTVRYIKLNDMLSGKGYLGDLF